MLDLWRKMMNAAKSVTIRIKPIDCLNKTVNKGKLKAANTEAKEMVLLIIKTVNQIKIVIPKIIFKPAILTESPAKTPKVVATPLPPLKCKKMVQLCPQIQLKPRMIQNDSRGTLALAPMALDKITTGRNPFRISSPKTVNPQPLPKSLRALVAPTLPEPNLRMSVFLIIRPKI